MSYYSQPDEDLARLKAAMLPQPAADGTLVEVVPVVEQTKAVRVVLAGQETVPRL